MSDTHTGQCFCGAVEIEVTGEPAGMGYCHCESCRHWSAGPVNAFTLWDPEKVKTIMEARLTEARQVPGKTDRNEAVGALRTELLDEHFAVAEGLSYTDHMAAETAKKQARDAFRNLEKKITKKLINEQGKRADGRAADQIRDLGA